MNWDKVRRVQDPTTLPVSLADAKSWLNIGFEDDDSLLVTMIESVASMIEGPNGYGIALTAQQYDLYFDAFSYEFEIPIHPVVSVESISYESSGSQTLSSSFYEVDTILGRIRLADGQSWPAVDLVYNPVKIRVNVGYTSLPKNLQAAVALMLGYRYENRENISAIDLKEIPMGARFILEQYRRHRFG